MNLEKIGSLILRLFVQYETDQAIVDAGGVATTTPIQIGTADDGKPLYARAQLCTNNQFPGG